jgi:hypothetical protein
VIRDASADVIDGRSFRQVVPGLAGGLRPTSDRDLGHIAARISVVHH